MITESQNGLGLQGTLEIKYIVSISDISLTYINNIPD